MKRYIIPPFYRYLPLLIGAILQSLTLTAFASCDTKECTYSIPLNKAGFYVPIVKLPANTKEGFWGLSLNTSSGLNEGGFNAGGVLGENANFPGFIGFYLTRAESVKISAYEYTGTVKALTLSIKDTNNNTVFGPTAFQPGETKDSGRLAAGFYTATVYSTSGDPRGRFGLSLSGNSFGGGVNVGSWIDSVTGGTGEGFGAMYVSSPQTVTLKVLFGDSYGSSGAGQPSVDIYYQNSSDSKTLQWSSTTGASTSTDQNTQTSTNQNTQATTQYFLSRTVQPELQPLVVPTLNSATRKYQGKSVITDSIDNNAKKFRDRTYYYDFDLDSNGKAYVLYAQPKPTNPNSNSDYNNETEMSNITLAIETDTSWQQQVLSEQGLFRPNGIQIKMDSTGVFHLMYLCKKYIPSLSKTDDYLVYRNIVNGQISGEVMVGDVAKGNVVGLGGWRTYMAISPDNQVYFIRESGTDGLSQPLLKLLVPDGQGNWTGKTLAGISPANWYRLGKFLIDSAGKPHIIFGDYAYDKKGQVYTANGYGGVKLADAFHNLWYASSNSLDGTGWAQFPLTEGTIPSLYDDQYWVDLALDEKDNPAVAKWLWKVGTTFPGYNTSTYFFKRNSSTWTDWGIYRATRSFDGLAIKGLKNNEQGTLSGMGPGLVKDQYGWHGVWDDSPPRPFEHANERGGIEYRFSPDGQDWSSYHVIAPFSAEGYCITKIDKQNRLNVLVLGDHTDTQLYFLRYQLPAHNWMEIFPDRRYYYNGETVTFHAQVRSGAAGDFYVFAIGAARPEISQAQEIWQMTSVSPLNWRKIETLSQLTPVQPFASATSTLTSQPVIFNGVVGAVGSRQAPFANPDTDYTIYAVVAKTGTNVLDQQNWVTPLMNRIITANKTL